MADSTIHLVQLLLPLFNQAGNRFPMEHYAAIRRELTSRFGGMTSYSRAPAIGVWEDEGGRVERDDIIVCEVMVDALDRMWWASYRKSLEALFEQDELVVRVLGVERL